MGPPQIPQTTGRSLLAALIVLNVIPEAVLQMAEAGWIGTDHWRLTAYSYGALWKGLLAGWQPNFPGQPATMFFSYSFLHAGAMHLAGNIAGLLWLAPLAARAAGASGLALIYGGAVLGGGLAFVLLSDSIRPMVGASGGVYGLAAAWLYWEYRDHRRRGLAVSGVWAKLFLLVVLSNLLGWWLLRGDMAWQTHVGGAVAAWGCAWALERRETRRRPAPRSE